MQKSLSTQMKLFTCSVGIDHEILHNLDNTESLLGWIKIKRLFLSIYSLNTCRPSYPLLALSRGLLLELWYQLSYIQLAQSLYRDIFFRKSRHRKLGGDVPKTSILDHFLTQLVDHEPQNRLLTEVNEQPASKNIIITKDRIKFADVAHVEPAMSRPKNDVDSNPNMILRRTYMLRIIATERCQLCQGLCIEFLIYEVNLIGVYYKA